MQHKVVIATLGSLGDLHPFLALGRALSEQGVQVLLAGAQEYRDKTRSAGLDFVPMSPSFAQIERIEAQSGEPLLAQMLRDREFILRVLVNPFVGSAYEELAPVVAAADCVVTSSLALGARFAAERAGVAVVPVILQPFMFFSSYDPPVIPESPALSAWLPHLPRWARAGLLALMKRAARSMITPLEAQRAALGLAPLRADTLFEELFQPADTIALYSPLLGRLQPDYPPGTDIVGFARFDSEDGARVALEPELERFLAAGAAPLVFTLGSVLVRWPGEFFRESHAAARELKQRAVLLVGPEQLEAARAELGGEDVYVGAYAPFSRLFPRAAAVVHHGGIGTLAQALTAGRPQLIVPHFADQPDNAARARRLGLARVLPPTRYRRVAVAHALRALMSDPAVELKARAAREQLLEEDGAALAARLIVGRIEREQLRGAPKIV